MANVTLLVSKTCSACPSAKTMWKGMKVKYSFTYREIDISSEPGQELAERHSIRAVPATIINGRLTFIGVPPRESAEKAIKAKAKPKPKKTDEGWRKILKFWKFSPSPQPSPSRAREFWKVLVRK